MPRFSCSVAADPVDADPVEPYDADLTCSVTVFERSAPDRSTSPHIVVARRWTFQVLLHRLPCALWRTFRCTMTTTTATTFEPFLSPMHGAEETLREIIEPVVVTSGLELIVLKLVRSQHTDILQLSVDRPGAGVTPGMGVDMSQLEQLNRLLGDLLDVEDAERKLFRETWELEVGSPGVDRPLTKKSHFKDVVGQKIKARLKLEKKSLIGILKSADDAGIVIDSTPLTFMAVDHAHVVYEFAPPAKPTKVGPRMSKEHAPKDKAAANWKADAMWL